MPPTVACRVVRASGPEGEKQKLVTRSAQRIYPAHLDPDVGNILGYAYTISFIYPVRWNRNGSSGFPFPFDDLVE